MTGAPSDQHAAPQDQRAVVGQRVRRVDGGDKVTGRARFTGDVVLPGMLHAALVKSDHPKGRLLGIDAGEALAMPGVRAVLSAADVARLGCTDLRFGVVVRDKPIFADGEVRFVGEAVAAVVADDVATARAAARLVVVDIEPEPAASSLEEAMAEGAPLVHRQQYEPAGALYKAPAPMTFGTSNVAMTYVTEHGDVEARLRSSDRVFEETYRFPAVYHYAMEPFCVVASETNGELTVWSSAQHPNQVEGDLARLFDLPLSRVRVIASYVGGGFGSKSFTHVEPIAALLSRATGCPVKLELDIAESQTISRRHNAIATVRTGVDADGQVVAMDTELHYDTGAYALLGPYVAAKGAFRALGGYSFPAYRVRSSLVYTNTSPAGSFRAIGGAQAAWALESQLDRITTELGIDPIEYRRRHVAQRGETFRPGRTPMDADLEQGLDLLSRLQQEVEDEVRHPGGPWLVGSGAAMGVSDPGASPVSTAMVRLAADGSLTVTVGSSELGQGVRTVISQIAAEALGVPFEHVTVAQTDTGYGPYDASTGASRSTTMSGLATQRAARQIADRVIDAASGAGGCARSDVRLEGGDAVLPNGARCPLGELVKSHFGHDGGAFVGVGEVTNHEFPTTPPFWEVSSAGATVGVDLETGEVRVLGYASVSDVGRVVNPVAMEGQEEGAIAQGIGHTLFEQMLWDEGQPITDSLVTYRVPRHGDVPAVFRSGFVENGDGPGPYGAKGGGEGPIVPVAGAIASALHAACGLRVRDLPLTPEQVWSALVEAGVAEDLGAPRVDHAETTAQSQSRTER